jgi:integrase
MDHHLPEVRPGSQKNIKNHIRQAQNYFQNRNVKDIKCGDPEDFIRTINLSGKSKHNIMSTLHEFYAWMKRRQEIPMMPEFPVIKYELGYRRTVDKETQQTIIEEIKRICPNSKVYLGIKWLATYFSVRPAEMISLTEGNIDLANGYFYFPHPKEKKYKSVPIISEDIEILRSIELTFPAMPFFRHSAGLQGVAENEPFGVKYFYKWWVKA